MIYLPYRASRVTRREDPVIHKGLSLINGLTGQCPILDSLEAGRMLLLSITPFEGSAGIQDFIECSLLIFCSYSLRPMLYYSHRRVASCSTVKGLVDV